MIDLDARPALFYVVSCSVSKRGEQNELAERTIMRSGCGLPVHGNLCSDWFCAVLNWSR